MLVITRRLGERLHIGEEIELVVTGIQGNRVRLGITGPHEVPIERAEVRARRLGLAQGPQDTPGTEEPRP